MLQIGKLLESVKGGGLKFKISRCLFVLLATIFLLSQDVSAWTRNQTVPNAPGTAGTSRAMNITSTTAGQAICVGIVGQNSSGGPPNITSVTDNKAGGSSTYVQYVLFQHAGDNGTQAIYCTLTAASGITQVTCTMAANVTSFLDCYVTIYTPTAGLIVTQDTGISGTNFGSSTAAATASITPTGTDNLVIALTEAPSVSTVSNAYNLNSNTDGNGWADKMGVGNAATSTTFTTTSGNWFTVIASIKGVAGGGGGAQVGRKVPMVIN